ncbi:hypothetical protein [Actinorugispora endophytica]|uniref:Uncharacterized protein n=1 Tax=Actinorugispora endophytica TaxID=1605990 RepID=A0A4R6UW20_9ACTN|nr:hypothetical protein [Actinorugispora endophytica]TDQ51588.1 hypothetical protein EV190_11077 [Actinorugispora endophytica]
MAPTNRAGHLPDRVVCPYCRAGIDPARVSIVVRDARTGRVVRDVTAKMRASGPQGVEPAELGHTYLVCERAARIDVGASAPAADDGWENDDDWTTREASDTFASDTTTVAGDATVSVFAMPPASPVDDDEDEWDLDTGARAAPNPAQAVPAETEDDGERLPEPHYVPYQYCQLPDPLNIGLVGTSASGKSHLLAAMLHRLGEETQELARLGIHVQPFAEMWDRYVQREDVAGFLSPARRTVIERTPRRDPVEFRMAYVVISTWGGVQRSRVVSFFDVAGELFDDTTAQARLQFIYGLDAYLFVGDGNSLYGWDGKRHGLRNPSGFDTVLNKVNQYEFQQAQGEGRHPDIPLPKPAAIVMAKADLQLSQGERWVAKWLECDDEFNLATVDEESEDVYVYCATNGARSWLRPVVDCEDVTLHFASATGCDMQTRTRRDAKGEPLLDLNGEEIQEGYYNRNQFRHMRVLRPLLSLLAMAGVVDPNEIGHAHVRGVRRPPVRKVSG